MEDGLPSQAQKSFVVAPLKAVYQSAKARFIMRPDALQVKEHRVTPYLQEIERPMPMVDKDEEAQLNRLDAEAEVGRKNLQQ